MKNLQRNTSLVIIIGFVSFLFSCVPPYKPDHDNGVGMLILADTCKNQKIYLMDIVYLHAYKSGYDYPDTLTVRNTTYKHVVRLNSNQSAFLDKRKAGDKISIEFDRDIRTTLPACIGVAPIIVETVNVVDISLADYQ